VRLNLKKSLKDDLQLASKNVAKLLKLDLEDLRQLMASIVTLYLDLKLWSFVYDCELCPCTCSRGRKSKSGSDCKELEVSIHVSIL
jgi:uncharacterized Fe-S radical SAM superfamily protein PflX